MMESVRKAIDQVLEKKKRDISPSKQDDSSKAFALFLHSKGIEANEVGKYLIAFVFTLSLYYYKSYSIISIK